MSQPTRILITAGPTREPIDDVRFISNRSSGRVGVAIAKAARDAGCDTTLLLGPILDAEQALRELAGVNVLRFETVDDLGRLLEDHFPRCELLVMAAAVSDYRAASVYPGKLARQAREDTRAPSDRTATLSDEQHSEAKPGLTLHLAPTEDLVARCSAAKRDEQRIIAFALEEPSHLIERAAAKMQRKGVDGIVANPLRTMDAGTIEATLLRRDAEPLSFQGDKQAFGEWFVAAMLKR